VRLLHFALIGGLSVISLIFLMLVFVLRTAPSLAPGTETTIIAGVLTAVGLTSLTVSLFVMKPRVPHRTAAQTVEAYWEGAARPGALLVWIMAEGGGIIGAVGFLMTSSFFPALVTLGALGILLTHGPGYFEEP
jgi:hypothetical protein